MYRDLTQGSISRSLILFALPMIAGNLLQPLVGQIKIAGNIHPVHPFFHGSDHTSRKIITLLYYSFSAFVVFPCHFSQASSLSTVDFL